MKTVLLLCLSIYIIENVAFAALSGHPPALVPFPKKVHTVMHKSVKLLNRRYEKTTTEKLKTKKHTLQEYTVFPPHMQNNPLDEPSSPYFPQDAPDEVKLRVKKVLPDFWSLRKKRSPSDKVEDEKNKEEEKTEAKADEKADKKSVAAADKKETTKDLLRQGEAATAKVEKSNTATSVQGKKDNKKISRKRTSKGSGKRKSKRKPKSKSGAKRSKSKKRDGKKSSKHAKKGSRRHEALPSRRLVAAKDALIEAYPYVVSIQKDGEHWCSGALLNQRLVITTANCVWKSSSMSRLKIRAGSRHVEYGGQTAKISQVMKHPAWSIRSSPDNDIALLLTDKNIKFSHSCHAVDLPNRIMMPVFDDAWVVSYGAQRRDGIYDKQGLTLQVYHARLLTREKCNNVTLRFGVQVSENFICLEQNGRRAPCTRDTGAPAVSDGVLWGLASWGIRKLCGTERFPAMFSYIASQTNMDFIINATHFMMAEERLSPFPDRYPFPRDSPQGIRR